MKQDSKNVEHSLQEAIRKRLKTFSVPPFRLVNSHHDSGCDGILVDFWPGFVSVWIDENRCPSSLEKICNTIQKFFPDLPLYAGTASEKTGTARSEAWLHGNYPNDKVSWQENSENYSWKFFSGKRFPLEDEFIRRHCALLVKNQTVLSIAFLGFSAEHVLPEKFQLSTTILETASQQLAEITAALRDSEQKFSTICLNLSGTPKISNSEKGHFHLLWQILKKCAATADVVIKTNDAPATLKLIQQVSGKFPGIIHFYGIETGTVDVPSLIHQKFGISGVLLLRIQG